ncbi:DUF7657 domain-containing protein [Clostridium neonatale]|uniref:DUF7657 domain-containing protein n=1 Tax=Clostridium neonatale TaxID=137838 RepID=UPI00291B80A6|nr:hypothetical protein [Clostridium neonatale]CAI3193797.1 conserved membrane hypothetical protein [Clostridium neonatale]CAI3210843.1 conserved membrane hypothetical protein [Clostridium neonatale]
MKSNKQKLIISTIVFLLSIIINVYMSNLNIFTSYMPRETIGVRNILISIIYILSVLVILKGFNFIYEYRYLIAITLFVLCVWLKLNGSSIAMWSQYINTGESINSGLVFGMPRAIRSDEWALYTPMALSQYHNLSGSFPYFSDTVRAASTDVFLVYGQPVKDIAIIFRPFQIGYLFLDPGRGLSFFWYGRLIALFMVTFEFGMLITKSKKRLSFILSMLISLSPIIQWWFSINGLVEMIIFGQLALIIINKYIKEANYIKKSFYMIVLVVCAGGYILTFYPSWQISLFYVFLAVFIWIIWDNYGKIKLSYKDFIIIIFGIILLSISMLHVLIKSQDTINIIMNTAYPGNRFETGGGEIKRFFNYAVNMFLPYKSSGLPTNMCEMAVFMDFFPLGIILAVIVMFIEKNKDKLLIVLLSCDLLLTMWCIIPFPKILAKLSLLSNSQPGRAFVAVGFINLLVLIRAIALKEKILNKKIVAVITGIMAFVIVISAKLSYRDYFNKKMMLISFVFLCGTYIFFTAYESKKIRSMGTILCICLICISGSMVNPIQKGVEVIYQSSLINAISDINKDEPGKWIVEGMNYPQINYPIMAGASTINSTNVYPDLERWRKFDLDGVNDNIYNRYAHINIYLNNQNTTTFIEGEAPDTFSINLNVKDLKELDVKYIFTQNNIEDISDLNVSFEKLYDNSDYKIYRVIYM